LCEGPVEQELATSGFVEVRGEPLRL